MDAPLSVSSLSTKDIVLCHHYAGFADHLARQHYEVLYWLLFSVNLCLLFTAARTFIWAQEALARRNKGSLSPAQTTLPHLLTCTALFFTSATIVTLQVFLLLGLQFCTGEPLIALYWSSWTVLQIGSVIAIAGVVIALMHTRCGSAPPPWGLALGTPILVVAASYHILSDIVVDKVVGVVRDIQGGNRRDFSEKEVPIPLSQVNTIQVSEPSSPISATATIRNNGNDEETGASNRNEARIDNAEIVGFTLAGGPIVRLAQPLAKSQWGNPEMVAMTEGNRPLLVFGPQGVQVTRRGELMV